MAAASLIGWVLMLNEGTTVRKRLARSVLPWLMAHPVGITSTGTRDSTEVRLDSRLLCILLFPNVTCGL